MKYKNINTQQVGDSKTPNKYWVTVSNDYYYFDPKDNVSNWISDLNLFEYKGKTIAVFDTYVKAKELFDEIYIGQSIEDIIANSVFIEDRISGELAHKTKTFFPLSGRMREDEHIDIKFTQDRLGKQFK